MNPLSFASRAAAVLLLCAATPALAVPDGILDPTFDDDGRQTIAFDISETDNFVANVDDLVAMAVAPGGRIYLAGTLYRTNSSTAIGVTRLRYDGQPDLAYGLHGRIEMDAVVGKNAVLDAALQSDGKLLLAGWVHATGEMYDRALVCRLLPDGAPDTGFGDMQTPGCRVIADAGNNQFSTSVLVQPDGRIVLAGRRGIIGALLIRLEPDGSDDQTFGTSGTILLGGQFNDSDFKSVTRAANGDLVAAGFTRMNSFDEEDVLLFRVDEHGVPDESFGTNGAKVIPINAGTALNRRQDLATQVHALADGSLIVTGFSSSDNNNTYADATLSYMPFVLRIGPDGTLDDSFGGGAESFGGGVGFPNPCLIPCASQSWDSIVLPDGRIVMSGFYRDIESNAAEFFAIRMLSNGDIDPSFGEYAPGVASIDFALVDKVDSDDRAQRIALDGARLILAGTATVHPLDGFQFLSKDFAVARLDHSDDQAKFTVTPVSVGNGMLSPGLPQNVGHSNHVEFEVLPQPGHSLAGIEGCDGALYGNVYTTGAVIGDCTVTATFTQKPAQMFSDSFEP